MKSKVGVKFVVSYSFMMFINTWTTSFIIYAMHRY